MATYSLTTSERRVVVSWVHERGGYLDAKSLGLDKTARQALSEDGSTDICDWCISHYDGGWAINKTLGDVKGFYPRFGRQVALVWWVWKHDGTSFDPATLTWKDDWVDILTAWKDSITTALAKTTSEERDVQSSHEMTDEFGGDDGVMGSGSHLLAQKSMIEKVLTALSS